MSVRQYIGARYVPRFSDVNNGNWSSVYSYEPLTIVKNGNDYYTSKKSVPVGVAITNTEYWVKTGDYNGAIAALNSAVTALTDRVEELETEYNKVIIIGDSYCTQYNNKLPKEIMANLNIPSSDYFISALGSTGFAKENEGVKFINLLMNASNHFNNDDVSHIIVLGGANDSTMNNSDITTAITAFVNYANTTYHNAKILYGFVGATTDPSKIREYARACLCYKANEKTAKRFTYLRNVEYIYHNRQYLQSDHVHPTESGYTEGARQIAIAIANGECDVSYFYTSPSDSSAMYKRTIYESIHNGLASIWVNNFDEIVFPSGSTPSFPSSGDLTLDIRDLTGNMITGSYFEDCGCCIAPFLYYQNGASMMTYPFGIYLYDGILKLRSSKAVSGAAINDINNIRVPSFCIQFNTLYC